MRNQDLITAFDTRTLKPEAFPHREHVRVAWILLRQHPLPEAATRFCSGLRALASSAGKPERYHETVTWAYLLLLTERIARLEGQRGDGHGATLAVPGDDGDAAWTRFAEANVDLLSDGRGLLERWYQRDTLDSPLARRTFVWPDRAPIAFPSSPSDFPSVSPSSSPSDSASRD
jgi:hypothetical protein